MGDADRLFLQHGRHSQLYDHRLVVHGSCYEVAEQFSGLLVMLFTTGVTGGGFVTLAATLPAVNLVPVGGLPLLRDVDRFMVEIRVAANLTNNVVATLVVARWGGVVDNDHARRLPQDQSND